MSTTDANSKSSAIMSSSTFKDPELTESKSSGNESNPPQNSLQMIANKVTYSSSYSATANAERVIPSPSNPVQGTSHTPTEGKRSDLLRPFGPRAKKTFPQPKRAIIIPQPVLGKDPNQPDIEVVNYICGKSMQESHQGVKVPIILQHSPKIKLTTEKTSGDEGMNTVSSTTSLFPIVGGEDLNISADMPSLTVVKSPSWNCEESADETMTLPVLNADNDSYECDLTSLEQKIQISSPVLKTKSRCNSQGKPEPRELATTTTAPITKPANKSVTDLQDVHHPSLPILIPALSDDLEAAMAKLHGEPLSTELQNDEMNDLSEPATNIVVTKIVEETSPSALIGDALEGLSDRASSHESDSEYVPDFDQQKADEKFEGKGTSVKQYKNHKIGPKCSKIESTSIRKPLTLNSAPEISIGEGEAGFKISTVEDGAMLKEVKEEPKTKLKVAATTKQNVRASRELEKLCGDEMVQNMFRELEEGGLHKRRSTYCAPPSYREEQFLEKQFSVKASRRGRRLKKEDEERTPPKKKMMSRLASKLPFHSSEDSIPQDKVLQQWQAVRNSTSEHDVVYVPRKLANQADVQKRRRSYSSDSSADGNQNNKRKTLQSPNGVERSLFALNDHSCSSGNDTRDLNETESPQQDTVTKLSSNLKDILHTCQDIDISFKDHLLCLKLCPRTSVLRNSLTRNMLDELSMVLQKLKKEKSIHVVLITSSGPDFCNGIDFPSLITENLSQRLESSIALAGSLQSFILELANCNKLLVGGFVGSVMGLGVAMIPYLNTVFASDKTTFCLPYVKLGQSYEGGLSLTLQRYPQSLENLMFFGGRRLTAMEAKSFGLIDDVFLPDNFEKEVVLRACKMAAEISKASLFSKKMSRVALRRDLPAILKQESQLLREAWISDEFQRRATQLYANGDFLST